MFCALVVCNEVLVALLEGSSILNNTQKPLIAINIYTNKEYNESHLEIPEKYT